METFDGDRAYEFEVEGLPNGSSPAGTEALKRAIMRDRLMHLQPLELFITNATVRRTARQTQREAYARKAIPRRAAGQAE